MCQSQETKDVKERLEDLVMWVTALEESLMKLKTGNDPEEGDTGGEGAWKPMKTS